MTYLSREDIERTITMSSRQAAKELGVGKSTINDNRKKYKTVRERVALPNARILILDIESKPGTAYVWGPKIDWLPSQMLIEAPAMMCFAYKWLGEPDTYFTAEWDEGGAEAMVRHMHKLLSNADIVVTYNGDRYDIKKINNEFLKLGMAPPSPYRSIDLFKTNRQRFDLAYKKLDYLATIIGTAGKAETGGFGLWVGCMNGDPESRAKMEEYNIQDVVLTEQTYIKLLPWLTNVPHIGMFTADGGLCPYCGSNDVVDTGEFTRTFVQKYPLYSCTNCQGWSRGPKPVADALETRIAR